MAFEMVRVDEWRCEFEMEMDGIVVGWAFGAALVEEEAMVVDEQEVEENEWDESGTGASTPDKVHSTEAVAKHKGEMNEQLVGHNMDL